jgi:hypothetical protein
MIRQVLMGQAGLIWVPLWQPIPLPVRTPGTNLYGNEVDNVLIV